MNKRLAVIHAQLFNAENELCAEADVKYVIFSEEVARKKYHYPGIDAFYE